MLFEKSWPIPPLEKEDIRTSDMVQAKILISTIDRLESEKDSLLNTVSDLRQLIKRLALQQEKEAQRRKNHSTELENEIKRLKNALKASENHSSHFQNISKFWGEFLE